MRIRLPFSTDCRHPETIVVRSAAMERIVCERCGHVSFVFDGDRPRAEPDQVPASRTTV